MFNLLSAGGAQNGHVYKEVHDEENESLTAESAHTPDQPRGIDTFQRNLAIFNILLLITSISILIYSFHNYSSHNTLNYKLKQVNTFSPILEQLKLDLHDTTVNGSVYNDTKVIWREEPSEEVDAAWERIARIKWFPISGSDVEKLGKDPSKTARIPDDWGYGANTHFASLDSQHLLHCLNTLRKYTHLPHYFPHLNGTLNLWHSIHLSHCTYILLQALTCQPSLNVITHNWVQDQPFPFPDFDIERKCVDYDRVWEWNMDEKRAVRYALLDGIRRPEGAWVEGMSKGYKEFLEMQEEGKHKHGD